MRTETKEIPINIRAKTSQRELIDLAATLLSKSRTEFILDAACREAEDVLLDKRLFLVNDEQYEAFIQALESPVTDNPRVNALLNRKAPWE
ncbi:type II toxin-antitoxin system TacA family antitoxin [Dickeya dianthicola]|uniref:type II toxin-antitoxin system TacA family antitoxin n=1 Tax=Dickeya dianthicola TaxID=204039 RepID=UPI0018696DC7|nr:DUF1778 domain-containing protein [Dickeya dianthicola]QOL13119.1 DUF1778 domain-containing protein [Dickeya dianthicola]